MDDRQNKSETSKLVTGKISTAIYICIQIVQFRALTYSVRTGESFKLVAILFEHQVMVLQSHKMGCVWKTPFRKSGHI